MAGIRNVEGKPQLDYTGSNLADASVHKEVKAMAKKYINRSGPRLTAKNRARFLALVEKDALMSDYYQLGFKNKKQVEVKIKVMKKSGKLELKARDRAVQQIQPTTSQQMLDALITQRAVEILEAMLEGLKSTIPQPNK